MDNSATGSSTYLKAFAMTNTFVTPATTLSYWIFPQSSTAYAKVTGNNSTCVAVDLIFADRIAGTEHSLRDSGATDQRGNRAHPAQQCAKLTLDTWNNVTVRLGGVANGREIAQVNIAYDQPANTGGFRGYVDDIQIGDALSLPGVADPGAESPVPASGSAIVESFGYPGAAAILAAQNVRLISGDGHIILVDCATPAEGDIGLLKIYTTDETIGADGIGRVCFKLTASTGLLDLEVPGVYEIRGDGQTTGTGHEVTADLKTDDGEKLSVDVDPDGSTQVGLGASPDNPPTMLLRLRVTG